MKVCIIYKKSVYQKYVANKKNPHLARLYRRNHPLTSRFKTAHQSHIQTLDHVKKILNQFHVPYEAESRRHIGPLSGYDLILTVGGDGTFLRTSHYVTDQIILGVNSAPHASIGALLSTTRKGFAKKIGEFLKGNFRLCLLNRIEISINGRMIFPYALNDVLFSHVSPAGVSRYKIKIRKKCEKSIEEIQRSSGIWIATSVGSTAAIRAAGGTKMPRHSGKIQYVVRELLKGDGEKKHRLLKGLMEPGEQVELINQTVEASLFIDGMHSVCPLKFGDRITIKSADCPLRVIA